MTVIASWPAIVTRIVRPARRINGLKHGAG
jgi:hypothetical protein